MTGDTTGDDDPPPPVSPLHTAGPGETVTRTAAVRRLLWHPGPLLAVYLCAACAVQLGASAGGLVRWSAYSLPAPLVAAALLPVRSTLAVGVATLVASVTVYGFAIQGVSGGGRTVVISAAVLSLVLSLVVCKARLRHQRSAPVPTERPVEPARSTPPDAPPSMTELRLDLLPHPAAVELAARRTAADGTAGAQAYWLDAIPLPGARVALVAGSVEDGTAAPAVTAELRAAVRTLADLDLQPEELLTRLEHVLARLRPAGDAGGHRAGAPGVTVSCLYAVYDPVSGCCTLAGAGCEAPTVIRPDGVVTTVDLPAGPPLGHARPPAEATEVRLPEGSVLLLRGHGPGTPGPAAGACAAAPPLTDLGPRPSPGDVCQAALDTLLSGGRHAHAGVLAARTRRLGSGNVATWELTAGLASASEARHRVAEKLTAWGLQDAVATTELIVSELVTNAVRHAGPPVRLRLIRQGTGLICEVSDNSSTSPHLRWARTFDESGRGLLIVAQLTRSWGTRHHAHGKTVWAEQHLPTPGTPDEAHAGGHGTPQPAP
ncbi:ATP-binding SpoIIE family protein phosphatase [Streptomyces sp. NPDC046870]|uniref:ATP-binding SpoIIE family protein phosphatase n=1 Tax=Streptomyces sp. NPDC046870 TaxID=3155135 RepID=UPI0034533BEC